MYFGKLNETYSNALSQMFSMDYIYIFMQMKLLFKENKLFLEINDMSTLKVLASGMNFKAKQRTEISDEEKKCSQEEKTRKRYKKRNQTVDLNKKI
jgi:hypothetical protein